MSSLRYSFDVFDTALTRTVARPRDLFRLLGERVSTNAEAWMHLRIRSEQEAHRRSSREEVSLEEIYQIVASAMRWTEEQTRQAIAAEQELEAASIRPVPEIQERVARLHRDGQRVLFISDVYLPDSFLREALVRHGFWRDADGLYLSSHEGVTKYSGGLYKVVMERERLRPNELCHAGDHAISDGRSARQQGVNTEPFTAAHLNRFERALADDRDVHWKLRSRMAAASRLARLARHDLEQPAERVLWDLGASAIGPMLVGYVAWCLRDAKRRGIKRLYFVSRDGQILHRIAQTLCRSWDLGIECRYLFGSRQAWHLPAITELGERDLGWMFDHTHILSVASLLRRVGFGSVSGLRAGGCDASPHVTAALEGSGFARSSWHRNLNAAERERLKASFGDDPIRSEILAEAEKCRGLAAGYLRQEGLLDSTAWALVDMGWSGRMQTSLRTLLRCLGSDRPVTGYYFALAGRADAGADDLVNSFHDPVRFAEAGLRYIPILETITAADHASVVGYAPQGDGSFGPIFRESVLEDRNGRWVRLQQGGAVAFAEQLGALVSHEELTDQDARRVSALLMQLFFGSPTREEALAYAAFRAGEDQAGGRLYRITARIRARHFWSAVLLGGRHLYRLRWPEASIAASLNLARLRMALLHGRQAVGGWKKRVQRLATMR